MLQACLNGKRRKAEHPRVPCSAEELADDALAVHEAGASDIHIHPRGDDDAETLEPATIAACLETIRARVPGMPIGVSTGEWITPDARERLDLIRAWVTLPDYASVNVVEADSARTIEVLLNKGIGVEAGLWTEADAKKFITLPRRAQCLRVLLEIQEAEPDEAIVETHRILDVLSAAGLELPVLLHGMNETVWPLVEEARRLGVSARVGLEDGLTLPNGSIAQDNRAIVEAAASLLPLYAPSNPVSTFVVLRPMASTA